MTFAVDVCDLPATGGSTFVVAAALFVLVAGVIVTRWVRQSAGRLSVVVAPLVLLGGLVLTPQSADPCTTTTTVAPTTTVALTCAIGGVCAVGDPGPGGGVVFYDAGSTQSWGRYLEAAPVATEVARAWATTSNQSVDVTGADGTAIGTGATNTLDIVNQTGNVAATSAAVYCDSLFYGGFDDWFLPSKDDLNQMYLQQTAIGGFSTGDYWSSSDINSNAAWVQAFDDGNPYGDFKSGSFYVRPVRAF